MPKNAQDSAAAADLVALGPDELAPVVPEMLRNLKHYKSPVSAIYASFFAIHGERFIHHIKEVLSHGTLPEVKWALLSQAMPSWSAEGIAKCAGQLSMLATGGDVLDTDLLAMRLLARHQVVEAKWLREWMEFKFARLAERTQLAHRVASEIVEPAH
jgi:tRNA A37 N6-isopentenylltransferase MiaA